ncbi:MAG: FHA domain-containing protein [Planctomycetes bacterium]|nr:FHA domain-containing protein [Planctomycetota bacterium]
MLGDLLFVRLKAAENALRDGRLDEAFRLASAPDLRQHRRGATVLATLTERFLERARNHFHADRYSEALLDLDRAEAGGVLREAVIELREQVRAVAAEQRRKAVADRERIEAARRRMEQGSLAAGREELRHAPTHDHAAQDLLKELERRAAETQRLTADVERLLAAGRHAEAVERLRRAKAIDAHHDAVIQQEVQVCARVLQDARLALTEGRLGRAADDLVCLKDLGAGSPARREVEEALGLARDAALAYGAGNCAEARLRMMSLERLMPRVAWIEETIERLRQVEDLHAALSAGPLGGLQEPGSAGRARPAAPALAAQDVRPAVRFEETLPVPERSASRPLPESLLLIVDGGGSYLLLRQDSVSIGRAASDQPADIVLMSDIGERHANVNRVDDDYFVLAARDVEVAGQLTRNRLLHDGDRILLGRKAKLTFRLPSRRSTTALLELSDTTKMPHDVRRVVLFHQHAALGAGPGAHIQCRHVASPLVLFERGGSLWVRAKNDGHVDLEARPLRLGERVEVAGAGLVLSPWTPRGMIA